MRVTPNFFLQLTRRKQFNSVKIVDRIAYSKLRNDRREPHQHQQLIVRIVRKNDFMFDPKKRSPSVSRNTFEWFFDGPTITRVIIF
jgi:hypothetical protein